MHELLKLYLQTWKCFEHKVWCLVHLKNSQFCWLVYSSLFAIRLFCLDTLNAQISVDAAGVRKQSEREIVLVQNLVEVGYKTLCNNKENRERKINMCSIIRKTVLAIRKWKIKQAFIAKILCHMNNKNTNV